MLPSTALFLSSVKYISEKRQIVVQFSNLSKKVSFRYSFFPRLYFPLLAMSKERFQELVCECDGRHFRVDFSANTAIVFAATFSDLKKLNNMLSTYFGVYSNLIEPERQFLIDKNWSYFDAFSLKDSQPVSCGSFDFPEVALEFLSEPLKKTMHDLLKSNRLLGFEMMKKIVYSRLVKIPLIGTEMQKPFEEIFLENVFFAAAECALINQIKRSDLKPIFHNKTEVDLSRVVALMSSMPFSNIGPQTLNCSCCKPSFVSEKNVLSSSVVRVKFLQEGFYFDSVSKIWAQEFHNLHANKDARIARKKEYSLDFFSAGPFLRNEEELILLADASRLQGEGKIEILQDFSLKWFCIKQEGALSKEINSLQKSITYLNREIENERVQKVAANGLFFSQFIDFNPEYFYRKMLAESVLKLLSALPKFICEQNSAFFNKEVAVATECLSGIILRDFEGVSGSNTFRCSRSFSTVSVDQHHAMSVLKRFSTLYEIDPFLIKLKQPAI